MTRPVDPCWTAGCACDQNRVRHWKFSFRSHRMMIIILWIRTFFRPPRLVASWDDLEHPKMSHALPT